MNDVTHIPLHDWDLQIKEKKNVYIHQKEKNRIIHNFLDLFAWCDNAQLGITYKTIYVCISSYQFLKNM